MRSLAVALVALSAGVVACSAAPDAADPVAAEANLAPELVLTESYDGKTITVSAGQTVKVRLQSNASTGYRWEAAASDLPAPDVRYIPGPARPGAPGAQLFTWDTAGKSGTRVLTLDYVGPAPHLPPAKTFSFTLVVQAPVKQCRWTTPGACGADEFCDFTMVGQCGANDAVGTCRPKTTICPELYVPVCGCDNETYANVCDAARVGVSTRAFGECAAPPPGVVGLPIPQ